MNQQVYKELFQRKTLKNAVGSFRFPVDIEVKHEIVKKWVQALESGTLDKMKETSLHGDFLKDIFQDVLGYQSVITGGGQVWEIWPEQSIADGGGIADAALGLFTATENQQGKVKLQGRVVAPIELKGSREDLDRPASGRKESAVDQGWRYANYTPDCQWIIISNYREIRLYHTNKTPAYFERFLLTELADLQEFKKFYFLLCRQNFLPLKDSQQAVSVIDRLLITSNEAQEVITKQLYEEYKQVRLNIVKHFRFSFGNLDILHREQVLIEKAQKALDRILFIAFCESRNLLPEKTLSHAHDSQDIYNPRPIWDNYKAVFRWVDRGNENPPITGYNGGLFQHDALLDEQLTIPNSLCTQLKQLTRFDFESEVSVDILGHIFEQSITDIEELKADVTNQDFDKQQGKRKKLGIYYTPAYITKYIVEVAIGGYLQKREEELREGFQLNENLAERQIIIDPAGGSGSSTELLGQIREIEFWRTYRDEVLLKTRVIDPACGSGAFLIAAFDYFVLEYKRVNDALKGLMQNLPPNLELDLGNDLELDRTILINNLFGVDLSPESVEITKLSLWLKTTTQGKSLTYLDDNIKVGNSIVDNSEYTDLPFVWSDEFPQVFADGGFDVVIGNPPYVRQELLSEIKPYLREHYQAYDGVADIYVYFYEKGLNLLKPGGKLSYIVSHKWLRSGYGQPLRRLFLQESVVEQIIDFPNALIFENADTSTCIVRIRKPEIVELELQKDKDYVLICVVPYDDQNLKNISLSQYVQNQENSHLVSWINIQWELYFLNLIIKSELTLESKPWSLINYAFSRLSYHRFSAESWSLEAPAVYDLMQKIKNIGVPLKYFTGVKPYRGILTGLNDAFLIDESTRNKLVQSDPKCAEIIKPYLRGQNIKRWFSEWDNLWIILLKSSSDFKWPWSENKETAEEVFKITFPSLYQHLKPFESKLRKRSDKGRYWWELRSCTYYQKFEQSKIVYQVIQTFPLYAFDDFGLLGNDKTFILPTKDFYLLGLLNSPLLWWYGQRVFTQMLSGAISPMGYLFETLPIAEPTEEIRAEAETIVSRLIELTKTNGEAYKDFLDWLQINYKIAKLGEKLEEFAALEFEQFVEEVRKRMPKVRGSKASDPLSISAFKSLRQAFNEYVPEIRNRNSEILKLEYRLSDLVNQAYNLTPEEIDLMWKTAPPRMPFYEIKNI